MKTIVKKVNLVLVLIVVGLNFLSINSAMASSSHSKKMNKHEEVKAPEPTSTPAAEVPAEESMEEDSSMMGDESGSTWDNGTSTINDED